MKRLSLGLIAALAISTSFAMAAGEPIKVRQELMKGNGDAMKAVSAMIKGEKPYDAKAAAQSMTTIGDSVDTFLKLFPKGTETGGDTAAKPEIWANKADFDSLGKALKDAVTKAGGAAAGGLDGFKAAMGDVGKACKACHEKYRVDKK